MSTQPMDTDWTHEENNVIDRDEVFARFGDDRELLLEIAEMFVDESKAYLEKIGEAISQGDSSELRESAHALKGSVGNFAAYSAYNAALKLEMMGRGGDLANAEEAYRELVAEIERLKPALASL